MIYEKLHSTYRGANIYRRSGFVQFRWGSFVDTAGFLYADTLRGIKELIKEAVKKQEV